MAVVGIILLAILALLLFFLLCLLFFPISYRLKITKNTELLSASAKVSWLFGFVRFLFDYPEPGEPVLKVLFFKLLGKEKSGKEKKKKASGRKEALEPAVASNSKESIEPTEGSDFGEASDSGEASDTVEASVIDQALDSEQASANIDLEEKPKVSKKGKAEKKTSGQSGTSGIDRLKKEFEFYSSLWQEKDTKPFVRDLFTRVFHILKNLLPGNVSGKLVFGAASPDVTGYVYGGYCVLKTMIPRKLKLSLEPDFEEQILECDIVVKGHFIVFTLLIDGLRILLDKRLRRLKKKLDQHRESK